MSLPADVRAWPESARDELEERIAIVQFLAKLPADRAERQAEEIVRARWARGRPSLPVGHVNAHKRIR